MEIICWNVRGINSKRKLYELRDFANKHSSDVLCLVETKVKEGSMPDILKSFFLGWKLLHNYAHDDSGRIWLLYNDYMVINLFGSSAQSIHCHCFHSQAKEHIL